MVVVVVRVVEAILEVEAGVVRGVLAVLGEGRGGVRAPEYGRGWGLPCLGGITPREVGLNNVLGSFSWLCCGGERRSVCEVRACFSRYETTARVDICGVLAVVYSRRSFGKLVRDSR